MAAGRGGNVCPGSRLTDFGLLPREKLDADSPRPGAIRCPLLQVVRVTRVRDAPGATRRSPRGGRAIKAVHAFD